MVPMHLIKLKGDRTKIMSSVVEVIIVNEIFFYYF
jgi:hypothetical protein